MSAVRKTIALEDLVEQVNKMLADSDDDLTEGREALGVLLETVLLNADAYAGFGFLSSEWDKGKGALREGYDDSRRKYYLAERAMSGRKNREENSNASART